MAKGPPTLARVSVGTSGWSYPSWRPGFYPAGTDPSAFLAFYAQQFPTVELNTTGYRLPAEDQFRRWAEQVPDGFEFAPKLPGHRLRGLDEFAERAQALGDRLGPVRVSFKNARDEGVLELLLGSLDPTLKLAFDLEHPSWAGIEERLAARGPFASTTSTIPRRFGTSAGASRRTTEFAAKIRALQEPVYVYFRHDEAPTAPAYAAQLRAMLSEA